LAITFEPIKIRDLLFDMHVYLMKLYT